MFSLYFCFLYYSSFFSLFPFVGAYLWSFSCHFLPCWIVIVAVLGIYKIVTEGQTDSWRIYWNIFSGCIIEQDTFYFDTTVAVLQNVATQQACADISATTDGGNFWTWKSTDNTCFVKASNSSPRRPYAGAVSGSKICGNIGQQPFSVAYSTTAQFELSFNNKLTTLPVLPIQWKVTFEFMPKNIDTVDWSTGYLNVLMVTSDSCGGPSLCRVPSVFFNPNHDGVMVQWRQDQDGFGPHYIQNLDWSLYDWTQVEISQEIEGDEIVCWVSINGVEKFRERNPNARELTNVDVYASDPWHLPNPSLGDVRGLLIEIKEEPTVKKWTKIASLLFSTF